MFFCEKYKYWLRVILEKCEKLGIFALEKCKCYVEEENICIH